MVAIERSSVVNLIERMWGTPESLSEYREVGPSCPHGLYVYDSEKDVWVLFSSKTGEVFLPKLDGYYVIYFDNTRCSACRKYDLHWFPYVRQNFHKFPDHYFIIVLCDWFARECKSPVASNTFTYYAVHSSPTTVLLYIKNGREVYRESYDGYLKMDELEKVVGGFKSRAEAYEKGMKVSKPIDEAQDIIKLLKRILSGA
ncbi:MAG: hypothetical protein RMH84_06125, partial [Sulfolobales archaeon]|nr:hypothetical protein [Sulfolobales archaeon]